MNSLQPMTVVAHLTFLNAVRNRILQTLVGIALLLLLSNFFFIELFSFDLGKVSVDHSLSAISLIGLMVIFFIVIRHLADDTEHRYIYFIFARPISSWQYIFGKYFGFAVVLAVTVLILALGSFAGAWYAGWKYPGFVSSTFSWGKLGVSILFQYEALAILLAATFFWVSCTRESFTALFLTVGTYLIGQNMELLRTLIAIPSEGGGRPMTSTALTVVTWIFPNLSFFDLKRAAAYGLHMEPLTLLSVALYGVGYIGILLLISILFFNRKEFT